LSEPGPLWTSFTITHVLDCIADVTKNRVVAELSDDISAVFPYVNAILPAAMYNPGGNSLTVRRGMRLLTFYPHVAVLAKVDGERDAREQLEWFRDICNDVWARHAELTPLLERRAALGFLDVYRLLPQSNCRQCGERTCVAFAVGLLMGQRTLDECPRCSEPEYADAASRLRELLPARAP
jgi:ArsR family metal-binding transcriptional regulator